MNKEHYKVWVEDGKACRIAYSQVDALKIGKASGFTFSIEFVNVIK